MSLLQNVSVVAFSSRQLMATTVRCLGTRAGASRTPASSRAHAAILGGGVAGPSSLGETGRGVSECVGAQWSARNRGRTAKSTALMSTHPRVGAIDLDTECDVDTECESSANFGLVQERLGITLSEEPTVPTPVPSVFVISGPSGVGKDAVIKRLQELRPDLHMVVTATSRAMREGEVNGVDYFFVTKEEFEDMIEKDELIEHAIVYGEYKGIPKQQVREKLDADTDVVLRVDVQGAATLRTLIPGAVHIFLVAESEAKLARRLVARKTETVDKLVTRVQTARDETARLGEFDYVVVNANGQLEQTANKLLAIIDVEKLKVDKKRITL